MSWLRRLSNTLLHIRVERDIDRELAFHIAERIDQLRADGLSLDEARREARTQFGNQRRVREEAYEMNSMGSLERLGQDVRITDHARERRRHHPRCGDARGTHSRSTRGVHGTDAHAARGID